MDKQFTVGLIGARGHTGRALLRLIAGHPSLSLAFASSRELAGQSLGALEPTFSDVVFETLEADEAAGRGCDVCILATPDGAAAPFVTAFQGKETCLIDLSADYRFDESWAYGLPELYAERERLGQARRIANPGCYATAAQIAIHPALDILDPDKAPSVFGVSGYSGAGTKPSPRNDIKVLADNLVPYALTSHKHEREVSHNLGRPVRFTPHVHPAFSGLMVTVHLAFQEAQSPEGLLARYREAYAGKPLISVTGEAPALKDSTGQNGVLVGGFQVSEDGRHGVVIAAEDNLLKGAAVQAVQNINIALGLDEMSGIL